MQKLFSLLKTHKIISGIIILVIIFGGYAWYKHSAAATVKLQYVTAAAQTQTITSAVTASGQVSQQNEVAIKPQSSGQLVAVDVKQGDSVRSGQTLAVIDERTASLSLQQAQVALKTAQANYDSLIAGPDNTDLAVDQGPVQSAQQNYNNTVAQQQLAVSKAQTALLNTDLTPIPSAANTSTATLSITGQYSGTVQGQYQISVISSPAGPQFTVGGLEQFSIGAIGRGSPVGFGTKGLFLSIGNTGTLNSGDTWTVELPNTQSTNYLSNYNAYQTALQTQTQQVAAAQLSLQQAQDSYSQKVAPPTAASVDSAQAQVQNAQVQLASAQLAYDNNILKSPFDGVVAQLNNHKGDQVSSSDTVATVITPQQIANVSLNEVDVSKIKLGNKVVLTFDALPDLSMTGTVAEIDTIGTVTQGVVTYNVQIGFDAENDQVKPGMSVNASIITSVVTDALAVPNAAVKTNATGNYVQILVNGQPQNKTVQVGASNDTLTQITSGLNPGDQVVTQTINTNAKTTTGTSGAAASGLRIPGLGGGTGGFGGGAGGGGGGFGGGVNRATGGGAAGGAARGN